VPGFLDYLEIPSGTWARAIGTYHLILNLSIVALFAISLALRSALDSRAAPGKKRVMGIGSGFVLVVEDDPDMRETLAMMLGRHGYDVATAADGAEALEQLRETSSRPCVVLLDLMMPRMNGFQLREAMLASDLTSIPVVALTGAGPAVITRAQEMHLEVLRKPISLGDLLRTVGRFCRRLID